MSLYGEDATGYVDELGSATGMYQLYVWMEKQGFEDAKPLIDGGVCLAPILLLQQLIRARIPDALTDVAAQFMSCLKKADTYLRVTDGGEDTPTTENTPEQDAALEKASQNVVDKMFDGGPQCLTCTHSYHDGTCVAFPDGVPDAILFGGFDHTKEYPGDKGMRYEAA